VNTTLVAGLNEKLDVRGHERNGHSDVVTLGQNKLGVVSQLLDEREDVVPSTTVKTGRVLTELVDDLVHLENTEDGLNENGTTDGTTGDTNPVLGNLEDIVPKTGLEVRLHLGKVEVRAKALGNGFLSVVEEVETKVKDTTRDGLTVNKEVRLIQVPATGSDNKSGDRSVGSQLVRLAALLERDSSSDSIVKVDLTTDHVVPGRSRRVLKIRHIGVNIGVQSVDDHLSISGTGDLNTSVLQTRSGGSTLPDRVFSDVLGLGEEIGESTVVNLLLALNTASQKLLAATVESSVEGGQERNGVLGEDMASIVRDGGSDLNAVEKNISRDNHCEYVDMGWSYRKNKIEEEKNEKKDKKYREFRGFL